jgi:hypothetical protein
MTPAGLGGSFMGDWSGWRRGLCILAVLALLASGAPAAEPNVRSIAVGLSTEHFSRPVVWPGDEAASKILSHIVSARVDIGLAGGIVFRLDAGLSLSDFSGLTFDGLPISLELDGDPIGGFALGAEVSAPLKKVGAFEIGAAGRFVYSFGMSKSWPLEDFAVEGEAAGQPSAMELSAGPRVAFRSSGRIVPYAEVRASLFWARFRISEILGDLGGEETKSVRGDLAVSIALGADVRVTDRISVKAKAGIMPAAGGAGAMVSIGAMYGF